MNEKKIESEKITLKEPVPVDTEKVKKEFEKLDEAKNIEERTKAIDDIIEMATRK